MDGRWEISTVDGVSIASDELIGVLLGHHQRLVRTWEDFDDAEWVAPSRNADWSVHETVRHVADAMEHGASLVAGGSNSLDGFDALATPQAWLAASQDERPPATIERYAVAAARLRGVAADRLASGDGSHDPTVYGTAHWSVNIVHLLWDSWLHERDVLIPLDRSAPSTADEVRVMGIYALLMSLVPAMMFDMSVDVVVELAGRDRHTISARCEPELIVCGEAPGSAATVTGDLETAVDALAGRGVPVQDALTDAPEELGFLAAFFNS